MTTPSAIKTLTLKLNDVAWPKARHTLQTGYGSLRPLEGNPFDPAMPERKFFPNPARLIYLSHGWVIDPNTAYNDVLRVDLT